MPGQILSIAMLTRPKVSLLLKKLNIESINAGVNGFGTDQALLMWQNEGIALAPEYLVLGYFVGDFRRNGLTVRDGAKPYFVSSGTNGFFLEGTPVPPSDELMAEGFFYSGSSLRLLRLLRYAQRRIYSRLDIHETDLNLNNREISDYILTQLRDTASAANTRFLVLIIGHCEDFVPQYRWIENEIMRSCDALGLDCINTAEEMRQRDYTSYFGRNCHWSPNGHQYAAERISEFFELSD